VVRIDLAQGRLQLTGHLDGSNVHLLQDAISTLLRTHHGSWVLDLSRLTACDPAGVRTIGVVYRRALRHNRRLTLMGTPLFLQRDLTRLRLDHHILNRGDGIPASPESPAI
jgi:anti-anti-sigma regulatory factor